MSLLIGKQAPDFTAQAVVDGQVVEKFTLSQFFGKKHIVLFFYPKDFSFVCPTEIIGFQDAMAEFEKRGAQVIGCSTDTECSHFAWLNTERNQGGIKGVTYPIVADTNKTIASAYGVLAGEQDFDENGDVVTTGELVAYRGLFVTDKQGVIQHQTINNFPIGRSIDECLRVLDAVQHVEKYGDVCPLNWKQGGKALRPTHEGISEFLSQKD